MLPGIYRIRKTMLGIKYEDGQRVAIDVPEGSEILVTGPAGEVAPLVNVTWQGKDFAMFIVDLDQDAERIASPDFSQS